LRTPEALAVPRLAERLVRWSVAPSPYAESLIGDLEEAFGGIAVRSTREARRFYWRRAVSLVWHYLPSHFRRSFHNAPSARAGDSVMTTLLNDLRFALRTLRRSPSFTIAAILALGLGTGSAAGVFSLLQGVVLRPLPYPQPDRLVMLWDVNATKNLAHEPISPVTFLDYRGLTNVFEDAAAWWRPQINLTGDDQEPIRVNAIEASENLFAVLGVRPMIGADFPIHPKLYGAENQAMIGHRLWQSRFNSDRQIVGKVVHLNGFNYTIAGVMPPGFSYPGDTDLWEQFRWDMAQHTRHAHFMESVARLKPGVTIEQAQRELNALTARLGSEFPRSNKDWGVRVVSLDREVAGVFRPGLFTLLGASALLLLIACINVANLLLARAVARRREVAVRSAMGASRTRLLRLFLTESFVLATVGAVIGLGIAVASVKGLLAWTPIRIPRAETVGVDFAVLLFATAIAVTTAVAFGLVPAMLMSSAELQDSLKDGTKGTGRRGRRLRSGLVVAEVALAVVLLSGAGLLIRSVTNLLDVDSGFDPTSTIAVDLQLPDAPYGQPAEAVFRDWQRVDVFYSSLTAVLRANPQVLSVGAANFLPLEVGWRIAYQIKSAQVAPADAPMAQYHIADEGYFSTLRVKLLRGRTFMPQDNATSVPVVVINETMAKQRFGSANPVGQYVMSTISAIGPLSRRIVQGDEYEIIGVINDIKNTSLRTAAEPAIYFAERQFPSRKMYLVVRGRGEPAQLASLVQQEVRRLDASQPIGSVRSMDRVLSESVDPPRLVMLLMTVFAALALTLAAVGIYGILTFMVSHRRREIGIRLAVGAEPSAMLRMIIREGVGLALAGCAIGVVAAFAAGRTLSGFLFSVPVWDPTTLGGVLVVVVLVAIAACVVPGRRAAAEDPVSALRAE
jgi:putative ABC transport system permease protein